ncbi:MAG: imidazole glycerol phosphate synthase subunit HisH, partial [Parcubacteria group bacterium]|nr:imidazole glycerol phosphate synthase subunit HisH [Parcubacteria group bacterium]
MIAIIDYGLGNLESVKKSLTAVGAVAVVTSDPEKILRADKIVLPGQGAFADGIKNLRRSVLIPILNNQVLDKKKPFLGICLGLQLLGETSF